MPSLNEGSVASEQGPTLLVVHCVDTEGPLDENLRATFDRLHKLFDISLEPTEKNLKLLQSGAFRSGNTSFDKMIPVVFSEALMSYNRNWSDIDKMLKIVFSRSFRESRLDDFGDPWRISWFCMDHVNYASNPRAKALGYSVVHQHYKHWLEQNSNWRDELQWHFHPKSISGNPLAAATSYANSTPEVIEILARRIMEDHFFPSAYRPGFHAERPDSHFFLEQWIPYDFGNQYCEEKNLQSDMTNGRFGDWLRAPHTWSGYHPALHDYQRRGECRRTIFRCLNLGTRLRLLEEHHVTEAFKEAQIRGSAILAFADHDFRDITGDIDHLISMLALVKKDFPTVKIKYCGAQEAAQRIGGSFPYEFQLQAVLDGNLLRVKALQGEVFGAQPFLALRTKNGQYLHDNLDLARNEGEWLYTFDDQTILLDSVEAIGVGAAGRFGGSNVVLIESIPGSSS